LTALRLADLTTGDYFRFPGQSTVWEYRGASWFAAPGGYDGGPWHDDHDSRVYLYACDGCGQNHCPGCSGPSQNLSCFL
jgi:hypothetical protein